ncbi:Uncharacterised protein [Mycobacteroides abscessus subsp. abscessus]|nr:Uncharacterised protein [Mycobacteroides abscessus subsp. abscessus]
MSLALSGRISSRSKPSIAHAAGLAQRMFLVSASWTSTQTSVAFIIVTKSETTNSGARGSTDIGPG